MFYPIREKSWSVFLVKGYIANDQVRAKRCENCKCTTEVLAANFGNPNLLLYGCKDSKCKHRLVRLDLDAEMSLLQKMTRQTTSDCAMANSLVPKLSG